MKINDLLSELRRNPTQNVKQEGHEAAVEFLKTIPDGDRKYYGVTMTSLPKLGVNPQSQYNTPLAICFYPAEYYLNKKSKGAKMEFQDDAPYIQIIEVVGNFTEIDEITDTNFPSYIKSLFRILPNMASTFQYPEDKLQSELAALILDSAHESRPATPGGRFWYILMMLSRELTRDSSRGIIAKRSAVVWNKLLRMLGQDVILDFGSGTLHPYEPYQGMAFDPTAVKLVKMFYNKPRDKRSSKSSIWYQFIKEKSHPYEFIQTIEPMVDAHGMPESESTGKAVGKIVYKILKSKPSQFSAIPTVHNLSLIIEISNDPAIAKFLTIGWARKQWTTDFNKVKDSVDAYANSQTTGVQGDKVLAYIFTKYKLYNSLISILTKYKSDPEVATMIDDISKFNTFIIQNTQ